MGALLKSKRLRQSRPTASRRNKDGRNRSKLIAALFTSTQERLLTLLFCEPHRTFFTTELIELAESGTGAVQRELRRLVEAELVLETRLGNQKHFQANSAAPIFPELRGIFIKTVGLADPITRSLKSLKKPPDLALVYGSIAKRTDTASSDVDLLLVSDDLSLEEVYSALAPAEALISRKISVNLLTTDELRRRRTDSSPFLSKVLSGEHLLLIG